ncbi:MAG TPA: transporter substrate-binding domain-containing protein [Candidatus Merdivicinus intestinavium]|nr:transporter substrate-binding domain-containing protein [Candidatus Merdivicinus intestinavium]
MKLKKILAALLAAALCISLAACGGEGSSDAGASAESSAETSSESSAAEESSADAESSGTAGAAAQDPTEVLTDARIGVQLGTTGDQYIDGDIQDGLLGDAELTRYNKGMEAVQALLQDKLDAVVIDNEPAKVFVEENEGLVILDSAYTEEDYAICIAKDNTELLEQFNTAIAELKEDGTLQQLLDYYINGVEGAQPYTSPEGITYNGTLTMATNAEFPPYEYHDSSSGEDQIVGLDVDFARAICDKLGMELEITDIAFDSIIPAVQSGKADFGAAGMTVTPDREENVNFTDSYCTGIQVVIVKDAAAE